MMKFVGMLFLAGCSVAVAASAWFYLTFVTAPASGSNTEIIYEVAPGLTFRKVAADLVDKGLVTSRWKLLLLARLQGGTGSRMRVGEYALRANMSPLEVLNVITSGKSVLHLLTISEGLNIYDIAALVEAKGLARSVDFLKLCHNPQFIFSLLGEKLPSLEGYLFPESYNVTKYTGAEGLVRMMVQRFVAVYTALEGVDKTTMTRHQVVTLASIIEKETGAPEERPIISSVFHNRLGIHMKLQTDPTVLYGMLDKTGLAHMNITRQDLLAPTRYNTYVLPGLPYGPIANPGRAALDAAIHPAVSEFLYFVSHNDGTHAFSKNYKDHEAAVRKFQLDPKARAGKSWRDLQKRRAQTLSN
jgi:UPF0755 protein